MTVTKVAGWIFVEDVITKTRKRQEKREEERWLQPFKGGWPVEKERKQKLRRNRRPRQMIPYWKMISLPFHS